MNAKSLDGHPDDSRYLLCVRGDVYGDYYTAAVDGQILFLKEDAAKNISVRLSVLKIPMWPHGDPNESRRSYYREIQEKINKGW